MAITLNGTAVVATPATGDATLSNVTCTDGDTILLGLGIRNENDTFTISDDDSNTWTLRREDDDDQCSTQIWSTVASANGPIAITVDANTATTPFVAIAQAFSGTDTTTNDGIEATNGAVGEPDDDDMLATVTTLTANAWVVGMGTSRSRDLTIPGGETEITINNVAGSGGNVTRGHLWYEGPVVTPASTQLGDLADLAADIDWTLSLVVLKPDTGAGGAQTTPILSYHQRSVYGR